MIQMRVPFAISASGYVDTTSAIQERISYGVLSAIGTRLGERVMKGDYGSVIPGHSFDALTPSYAGAPEIMIENEARKALGTYYPQVQVTQVSVDQEPGTEGAYRVSIQFTVDTGTGDLTSSVVVNRDLLTGN